MSKIQILDDKTINQIAAGEVIENAASCVKELVENAIDAGSSQIEVQFFAGGRKKLCVIDNGFGMNPDDALLALERHATSKIHHIQDMDQIQTMGFRGEAIPSIASISKFSIQTSEGEKGSEVICHGGKLIEQRVCSRVKGTTVIVESLFYNVPARREFQKSVSHDSRAIINVMTEFALAYPMIEFKLIQDHGEVFNLIPKKKLSLLENLKLRIGELFGQTISNDLIMIDSSKDGIALKGFIAGAKTHRPNRLGQHLFINQRTVDSKLISVAVREGYSTRLEEGRYPVFFLSLLVDPKIVDVNVHPQKKEIRFKDPFEVKNKVTLLIDQALRGASSPEIAKPFVKKEVFAPYSSFFDEPIFKHVEAVEVIQEEPKEYFPDPELQFIPQIIGLFSPYIFVEAKSLSSKMTLRENQEEGMILVHQTRAQERILFDTLVKRGARLAIQTLLIPETFEFSLSEAKIIENYMDTFQELGLAVRALRKNVFILDGLPSVIEPQQAKDLIEKVLEEVKLNTSKNILEEQKRQILAGAIAKKVRPQKVDDENEANVLVTKLFKCENFEYTPKGKPIVQTLTLDELAKKFR